LKLIDTKILKDLRQKRAGATVHHVAHLRNISYSSHQLAAASAAHAAKTQLGEITKRAVFSTGSSSSKGSYCSVKHALAGFQKFKGEPAKLPIIDMWREKREAEKSKLDLGFKDARRVLTKVK
jgi:hypothetical protein